MIFLDLILIARRPPVGVSALDKEEVQQDPGHETANMRPPRHTADTSRTRQ